MKVPASTSKAPATASSRRSPVERILVWGGILALLVVVGIEYSAQHSFHKAWTLLNDKLEAGDIPNAQGSRLTSLDVPKLLGKEPEFKGHPGQIKLSSQYYEAYVFRSLFKTKFSPPPEKPEIIDINAIYSGNVRPDLIKYRTPEKREPATFFTAPVLFVYYGPEDPKTHVREVVSLSQEREKYYDEYTPIPDQEELKRRHDENLATMISGMEKMGGKLTADQKEKLDPWKYPQPRSDQNSRNLPSSAGNTIPSTTDKKPG